MAKGERNQADIGAQEAPQGASEISQDKGEGHDGAINAAMAAERVGCLAEEVLSFRDYGNRVVVVTVDGLKLEDRQ